METPEELLLRIAGRMWFNEDDDLDDEKTGYVEWKDALIAIREAQQQVKNNIALVDVSKCEGHGANGTVCDLNTDYRSYLKKHGEHIVNNAESLYEQTGC